MSRVDASYLPVRADQVGQDSFALSSEGTIPSSLLCTYYLSPILSFNELYPGFVLS